jgi:hypothetical protein
VCFILAYLVAAIFLNIYGMSASTILQCFLVDEEYAINKQQGTGKHRPDLLNDFVPKIEKDSRR